MITTIPKRNNDSNRCPITFATPIVNNKYIATEIKMLTLSITENKSNALRKATYQLFYFQSINLKESPTKVKSIQSFVPPPKTNENKFICLRLFYQTKMDL